jgi:hypothetical protein
MNERERIVRTLRGERTEILPWTTRINLWHTTRLQTNTLPDEMEDLDLTGIHRHLNLGRQCNAVLTATRLHDVDVCVEFNGTPVSRESTPTLAFPTPTGLVVRDKVGDTTITFETPVGDARVRYRTNEDTIRTGSAPYQVEHILKDDDDFRVVKWMLDHAEIVPSFEQFFAYEKEIGDDGFTIGYVERVPFQRLLIDFMGEERAIYWMHDDPRGFELLLDILTEQGIEGIKIALDAPSLVIDLPDNFEGSMTSPKLFQRYCMPFMQQAAELVHAQDRFLASHMDGNMKPLLHLIPESGVDIVESFSPEPLTRLTFADAWQAWQGQVLVWGGIPSPIFEAHFPENQFETWMEDMLELVGAEGRIILGIGDQGVGATLIERVKRVSQMLGRRPA